MLLLKISVGEKVDVLYNIGGENRSSAYSLFHNQINNISCLEKRGECSYFYRRYLLRISQISVTLVSDICNVRLRYLSVAF